jgi:hypothetical protein
MSLFPESQQFIDDFFRTVALLGSGYLNSSFCYVAIKAENSFVILHAKLLLNPKLNNSALSHFRSENVRAGHYRIAELQSGPRKFVDQLLSGKLSTPDGELSFPPNEGGYHGAAYIPFHPDGLRTQRRISVLQLMGGNPRLVRQPDLDWEIKAADTPYDSLQELMFEYQLGLLTNAPINVEIAAFCVAEIDTLHSTVSGKEARIHILAAEGVATNKVKVGYRVNNQGRISSRSVVDTAEFKWSLGDGVRLGEATFEVPPAAMVNAIVSYDGIAQHHWWFSDPTTSPNARRAVYEAFDVRLETLKDILAKAQGRNPEARQLEAAVAWILWMLGFSVAHLGGTPRTQDAVDLVATTPKGHFIVIECTTGLLKAGNKLSLLYDRTESVRRSLIACNQSYLRVIPVIVTSKTREEVRPDLEQAERLGIWVIAREDFDQIITRTSIFPDADRLYDETEASIQAAQGKYQLQEVPSLSE